MNARRSNADKRIARFKIFAGNKLILFADTYREACKVESIGLMAALGWCVFPFILPDCVKIALAILIAKRLPKRFVYQSVATKKDAAV